MDWIPPMEPISTKSLITGQEWVHQIKWDGIRGLTYYDSESKVGKSLRIFTKKGRERTDFYPELHRIQDLIRGKNAVLDGEMVVLGEDSKPAFQLSLIRERVGNPDRLVYYTRKYPVMYVLFDILYLNGQLLTGKPFEKRMEILRNTIREDSNIAVTDDFNDGRGLFELMKKKNWEGIVSKKLGSPYLTAKNHKAWYKYKTMRKILTAVCGIQLKDNYPNSLILGIYKEGEWVYVGKASLGLTQKDLKYLKEYSDTQRVETFPFSGSPRRYGPDLAGSIAWLKPAVTCWIGFLEWTNDGVLRHPKILGFTSQKAEEADGKEWSMNG
jgi:bifunctional non-homologous end joining protein LigD